MKTEQNTPSDLINCSNCKAVLSVSANFCSICGKRVKHKQNDLQEADTVTQYSENLEEQKDETIRLVALPQIYLSRWLSYQSLKNSKHPYQLQASIPSIQDSERAPSQPTSSQQKKAPSDETMLLNAPTEIEQEQALPTVHTRSLSKTGELTSDLPEVLWPTIIILSALAAALVNFVFPATGLRPIIEFWFVSICPGMIVVRFLHLQEPVVEFALAIALSFAIGALVAGLQLYAGKWSPGATLITLIIFCLLGAIVQFMMNHSITSPVVRTFKKVTGKL